ncbi:MAG: hypothetical protein LUG27_10190 [Clostridiales bacterium]|nr:hypothetical protein [Clostridiales bacterium]
MHRNYRKVRWFMVGAALLCLMGFAACATSDQEGETVSEVSTDSIEDADSPDTVFSVEDYQEKILRDLTPISVCREQYDTEIETVRHSEYSRINFENCEFDSFPESEDMKLLVAEDHGITVEESWDTIENWLESIGKKSEIDMETEVKVVSTELGVDAGGNYYTFYNHMSELSSGEGAFIDNNLCHIQITSGGIYSMSDGKITEYLGSTSSAAMDALGYSYSEEDVVAYGSYSELANEKYELASGEMTVEEGAEMVLEYFRQGTPFPPEEGVENEIAEVCVFKLKDIYAYEYIMRRIYDGIPLAYMQTGSYQINGDVFPACDNKNAYVMDDSGVTAFSGYNEAEKMTTLYSEKEIIGLEDLAVFLDEKLASQLNIKAETAGLVYYAVNFLDSEDPEEKIIFPCWEIRGVNQIKNEGIRLYVDVFTGDIYYYTYRLDTEE